MSTASEHTEKHRGAFSSRKVFIFAAIGSAVGLGNIWRFPYVAYENGGGAFILPYLIALLTAGLPFLLLDYGLGHRFRGSAPLSFRRASKRAEALGYDILTMPDHLLDEAFDVVVGRVQEEPHERHLIVRLVGDVGEHEDPRLRRHDRAQRRRRPRRPAAPP